MSRSPLGDARAAVARGVGWPACCGVGPIVLRELGVGPRVPSLLAARVISWRSSLHTGSMEAFPYHLNCDVGNTETVIL